VGGMLILCHVRKKVELEVLPAAVRRRRRGRVERRGRLTLPTAREGDESWGRLLPMLLLRGVSERAAEREGSGFGAVDRPRSTRHCSEHSPFALLSFSDHPQPAFGEVLMLG
jgi:hypothetical protein